MSSLEDALALPIHNNNSEDSDMESERGRGRGRGRSKSRSRSRSRSQSVTRALKGGVKRLVRGGKKSSKHHKDSDEYEDTLEDYGLRGLNHTANNNLMLSLIHI